MPQDDKLVIHMKIETIEIAGFASALRALRLPYGLEPRSECKTHYWGGEYEGGELFVNDSECKINAEDFKKMQTLITSGDEHAKVMRGIVVWAKITAPVYWYAEEETYIAGHQRLCSESTMHIDCRGLKGEELQKAKAAIPMGKELTKIDFFSYQCLRNMYKQRKNHRLPEWRIFCEWIETLPFAKELIVYEREEVSD